MLIFKYVRSQPKAAKNTPRTVRNAGLRESSKTTRTKGEFPLHNDVYVLPKTRAEKEK